VQPCGDDAVVVRDCVLFDWQLLHAEYVKEVQVGGAVTVIVVLWLVVPPVPVQESV